ncbi:hypothetical protein BDN72DRAFT_835720 [Pluteus cervinus]|uniref:Uncharacterized protein n=1 Tax=Pluteus cervinus TaxID=181527 RepID=A0ACD3B408_9AGAR|nr:hypothetical protein BDN72DRAFT_835720 [Pluteus cervinus]
MQSFGARLEERFEERLEVQKTELQAEIEQAKVNHAEEKERLETELRDVQTERDQERNRADQAQNRVAHLQDALKAAHMEKWYWVAPLVSSYLTWGTIMHLGFDLCLGLVGGVLIGATSLGLVYLLEGFVLPWWHGEVNAPQPTPNQPAEANNVHHANEKAVPMRAPVPSPPRSRFLNWTVRLRTVLPSRFGTWLVGVDSSVTRLEA